MKNLAILLNYPLQNQIDVGHLDVLMKTFKNALNEFDKVTIISPRDNRKYDLGKNIEVISNNWTNPLLYYLSPLKDFWTLWKIARKSETKLIRVFAPTSGFVAGIVGKLTNKPVFLSVHTNEKIASNDAGRRRLKKLLLMFAEPLSLKLATKIGVISEHIKKYALSRGANPKKVFLHRNFVDLTKFKPSKNKSKRFVFIGRFTPVKAPLIAIKAAEKINAKLWMIGDGPLLPKAKKMAGKNAKLLGRIKHEELPKILNKCNYFVAPATAGFTLIEAFASGLPAAAADLDWTKEMVVNGKTGYLCKAYDVDSLAKAMKKLLKNGEKMRTICVKKSREFSLKEFKQRELNVYRELISK